MRRGSVITFVDDGRRHSAGMVAPEVHRNSRQEFTMQDVANETVGGCFVSYRKIAFAVVFVIALLVAGAFIGVYINLPVYKELPDSLTILAKEVEPVPEKYVLADSIRALEYRVTLEPEAHSARARARVKGHVALEFEQSGLEGPSQVVLDCKNLMMKAHRIYDLNAPENATQASGEREKPTEADGEASDGTATSSLRMVNESSFRTELKINGNKTDVAGSDYVIFLENPLRHGNYLLEIEYETEVDDRVMFVKDFSKNNGSRLLLVSKLKPSNAPRLFPTLDEAKLKATFVLTLLHPRDTKVLSNTPLMNTNYSSEEVVADTFAATPSMLPHNLAFVVGASDLLAEVESSGSAASGMTCYGDAGREPRDLYLMDKIEPTLETCAAALGRVERPAEKIELAALPVDFDGLSAPGLIVMRDLLFYTENGAPSFEKAEALRSLVGLVAHQWLGGLVNAKNWTDAWYIEGSVLYLQYALLDKIDPSLDHSEDFLVDVLMDVMESDGYQISKALDSPVNRTRIEAFDLSDTYKKGACLISMLHGILGEGAPGTGYADFLRRWGYSRADSATFLKAVAGNSSLDGRTSFSEALAGWTRHPGYPMVNVTWNRDNETVSIRQMKFNFDEWSRDEDEDEEEEEEGEKVETHSGPFWWVPLTYVITPDDWTKPTLVWLKGKEEMTLENFTSASNDSWVVFNVNRNGYYRVNYDEENWRALSEALLRNHEDIPAATRASLLDDALSLARQGSLGYETAFELLRYLGPNERSYGPWRVFSWHARQLDFVLYENQAYPSFQAGMRKWTSKLFDDMESQIDEGLPLAVLAMQLACTFEYQKCTDWAKDKWNSVYNKSEAEITLARHVRETVYCIGAQRGGQEELSYLTSRVAEATDRVEKDQLLSALSCFQRPWILQKVLNDILDSHKYEENDVKVILQSYAKNPAASKVVRRFVQENWEQIMHRFSNSYWSMKALVEASMSLLFTDRDLREFNTFRDKNIESLKAMGHWVALSEMKAISWVSRLKRSSSSIRRWLESHTDSSD